MASDEEDIDETEEQDEENDDEVHTIKWHSLSIFIILYHFRLKTIS